jgi:hypothetical protein
VDDERWEPGMPVLDRQPVAERSAAAAVAPATAATSPSTAAAPSSSKAARAAAADASLPPSLRGLPPRSVPETAPTPLQRHYVLLSAPALVLGAIAITALNLGFGFDSLLVKACVLIAGPLLLVTTADATLRIWRSAWAWMPVDRGRGLFRLAWVVASVVFLALIVLAIVLVLQA